MIRGESDSVEEFWGHYADAGQRMRRACRELLFELNSPMNVLCEVEGLRLPAPADLELIVPVHADLAESEISINPLATDAEGFHRRCLRRLEHWRAWVL